MHLVCTFIIATFLIGHGKSLADQKKTQKPLTAPRLTIMIVVDQLGDIYIKKIKDYLKYGLKTLLDEGTYYPNAYHPHGMPSTATGHAALNTGAFAKFHGIIGNTYINKEGNKIECDADTVENAAIFNPVDGSFYQKGASAAACMVDGVSDQFILASPQDAEHKVFALSLKSRSSTLPAGMGKALWFDQKKGLFTTNKKSFSTFPQWLKDFNTAHDLTQKQFVQWIPMYPKTHAAYKKATSNTYAFTHQQSPRVNTQVPIHKTSTAAYKEGDLFSSYQTTPHANQLLIDLAKTCLEQEFPQKSNDRMLLWLCLSPLDKLGHDYGPDSVETTDLLYWLDKQLGEFIQWSQKKYGKKNILFCLTGDHGISPIVEVSYNKGFTLAHRFYVPDMLKQANRLIKKKYGIKNVIAGFKCPQIYINHKVLEHVEPNIRAHIMEDLITFTKALPGVKDAWTFHALKNGCFLEYSPEYYLQQQLFEGRSGEITMLTYPHSMVTKWKQGADHRSPYQFNLHVPVALYWPGSISKQVINDRVLTLQLPKTVASLNQINAPSACVHPDLPYIR